MFDVSPLLAVARAREAWLTARLSRRGKQMGGEDHTLRRGVCFVGGAGPSPGEGI